MSRLIIDIDDKVYGWIKDGFPCENDFEPMVKAIANGILLEETKVSDFICENCRHNEGCDKLCPDKAIFLKYFNMFIESLGQESSNG